MNSREERNREEPELLNEWRLNLEEGKSSLADISQYIDTEKLRLADKETVLNERKKDKTKRLDNAFKLVKEGVKQRSKKARKVPSGQAAYRPSLSRGGCYQTPSSTSIRKLREVRCCFPCNFFGLF